MSKKIKLALIVASMFFSVSIFAWTPIQLSFWDGVKNLPNSTTVNGLKLGLPFSNDYWGVSQEINGMELSVLSESANIDGFLLAVVNLDSKDSNGLQICGAGVTQNFEGVAIAAYNEFKHGSKGLQIGAVNTAQYNTDSFQLGAINNAADSVKGTQVGAINTSYSFDGIQIGVFNTSYRRDSKCLQIGLININENGWFPFFPFFNFSE